MQKLERSIERARGSNLKSARTSPCRPKWMQKSRCGSSAPRSQETYSALLAGTIGTAPSEKRSARDKSCAPGLRSTRPIPIGFFPATDRVHRVTMPAPIFNCASPALSLKIRRLFFARHVVNRPTELFSEMAAINLGRSDLRNGAQQQWSEKADRMQLLAWWLSQ